MPRMGRRGPGRAPAAMMARRMTRRRVHRMHARRRRRRRRILVGGLMVVGTGALAYKMTKSQQQQVEEASGTPIEEMSDEEIQEYVKKYNIPVEGLDDSDKAAVAEDGDQEEYYDDEDYTEELENIAELHDKGILTDEEFEAKKKQILDIE
jgi:3'-phosphoadenosine 5'-phosphosulfate sulfotransferase (PAPS reductase)/FAD synthetase